MPSEKKLITSLGHVSTARVKLLLFSANIAEKML
jgi:hypothetical protein